MRLPVCTMIDNIMQTLQRPSYQRCWTSLRKESNRSLSSPQQHRSCHSPDAARGVNADASVDSQVKVLPQHSDDCATQATRVDTNNSNYDYRALEYREATARKCVEKAFRSPGPDAIVYLRRAAELCGDANFVVPVRLAACFYYICSFMDITPGMTHADASISLVQGLSRSCMQYVQTHPSKLLALEL